jgi:hypothetical protein
MHTEQHHNSPSSNINNLTTNDPYDKAIGDLESGKCASITAAAEKHMVHRSTLSRRYNKKTVSRQEAASLYTRNLSNAQEQALITWINGLSTRGLHPTPEMVKNKVEYLLKHEIGKNWVAKFCQRYSKAITSKFLKEKNKARHLAGNEAHSKNYYDQVGIFSSYFLILLLLLS